MMTFFVQLEWNFGNNFVLNMVLVQVSKTSNDTVVMMSKHLLFLLSFYVNIPVGRQEIYH